MKKATLILLSVLILFAILVFMQVHWHNQNAYTQITTRADSENYIKFNINTVTAEELQLIPGIGSALSRRIVEYREEKGPYSQVNDLLKVKGIGPNLLVEISDYLTVGE